MKEIFNVIHALLGILVYTVRICCTIIAVSLFIFFVMEIIDQDEKSLESNYINLGNHSFGFEEIAEVEKKNSGYRATSKYIAYRCYYVATVDDNTYKYEQDFFEIEEAEAFSKESPIVNRTILLYNDEVILTELLTTKEYIEFTNDYTSFSLKFSITSAILAVILHLLHRKFFAVEDEKAKSSKKKTSKKKYPTKTEY